MVRQRSLDHKAKGIAGIDIASRPFVASLSLFGDGFRIRDGKLCFNELFFSARVAQPIPQENFRHQHRGGTLFCLRFCTYGCEEIDFVAVGVA